MHHSTNCPGLDNEELLQIIVRLRDEVAELKRDVRTLKNQIAELDSACAEGIGSLVRIHNATRP